MRQSGKEKLLQSSQNRLLQGGYTEAVRQHPHGEPEEWTAERYLTEPLKFLPRRDFL